MKLANLRVLIYLIYIVLLILGLYHHEMWRDEYEEFLQARDAEGLLGLENTMNQGHAMLWQGCLWIITRFTHNPVAMQILHGLIAACVAFVLIFKSPFKIWQSGLLLLGYFFLFEYAIISRCYAFGVLFILLFAGNYSTNLKLTWQGAILLFLLANTSVYAMLLTTVLAIWILAKDVIFDKSNWKLNLYKQVPMLLLVIFGILMAYLQIHPSANNSFPTYLVTWPFDQFRFEVAFTQLFSAFVPICKFQNQHFWNTNFMMNIEGNLYWLWSLLVLCIISIPFVRRGWILLLWMGGIILVLFFQYYIGLRYTRYYGHFFILWLICMWLASMYYEPSLFFRKINTAIFTLVILAQAIGGIMIYKADWKLKFSRGKEAAKYLEAKGFSKNYMMGSVDFALSPIAAELDRKIYYMQHKYLCSFTKYDKARLQSMDSHDIVDALNSSPKKEQMIFIATHPIPQFDYFKDWSEKRKPNREFSFGDYKFYCLAYFKPGIEHQERYWLFKVEKNRN